MLKHLIILLVAFQLTNLDLVSAKDSHKDEHPTCIIFNEYNSEYLYTASMFYSLNLKRTVYTWKASYLFDSVYYDSQFNFTAKDPKGVWIFVPVEDYENTFYIKSKYYDDFMYADKGHWAERRYVHTQSNIRSSQHESFMWKVRKAGRRADKTNEFYITNVQFDEKLAPAKDSDKRTKCKGSPKGAQQCYKVDKPYREVFTWPEKKLESEPSQLEWVLKCKDNNLPQVK
jgi:hypothetical protein